MTQHYLSCQSHCCFRHGCKYGHDRCPVTTKEVAQDYPCEECNDEYSDVEVFKKMLEHAKIDYEIETMTTNNPRTGTLQIISIPGGHHGYVSEFKFDRFGDLAAAGAYE